MKFSTGKNYVKFFSYLGTNNQVERQTRRESEILISQSPSIVLKNIEKPDTPYMLMTQFGDEWQIKIFFLYKKNKNKNKISVLEAVTKKPKSVQRFIDNVLSEEVS